jgi:hypothetical protein
MEEFQCPPPDTVLPDKLQGDIRRELLEKLVFPATSDTFTS